MNPDDDIVYLSYARSLLDHLSAQGHDVAPLLTGAGLTPAMLDEADRTIPAAVYAGFWEAGERLTRDPALGLHVGELIRPSKYGVLGYVAMSCETLGESLLRQKRYQDLVGKSGRSELVRQGDACELRWYSDLASLSRHVGEEHLASWVAFARWMLGTPGAQPRQALFEHSAPDDLGEHRRIFGCELMFDQPYTAVVFAADLLQRPLRDKNAAMRRLMDLHAETLLAQRVQGEDGTAHALRAAIAARLTDGPPSIDAVAAQLKIPARTLQRRLAQNGTHYRDLLDDVRRRLALRYIGDSGLELPEIAFLLGFAEQSSFQRAFKRWTGLPPGQYRHDGPPAP